MNALKPAWWQSLTERADLAPERPRLPLHLAGVAAAVGSAEPALAERLCTAGLAVLRGGAAAAGAVGKAGTVAVAGAVELRGPPDAALAAAAGWLAAQGLGGSWRDELLPVRCAAGTRHAVIERAAVRPLGIATFAVHLIGFAGNGELWLQQRALAKATDPGQWDTLVGGLVAAGESHALALERETWEEAGLRLAELQGLEAAGRISIRRPVSEGYLVEHIDVFEAVVPEGLLPVNQDGEVARFERLAPAALVARLAAGAFTLEAALMLAESLRRRGLL